MKTGEWNETFNFDEEETDLTTAYENTDNIMMMDSVSVAAPSNMSSVGVRSAPFLLSDHYSLIRSLSVSSSLSDVASSSYDLSSDTLNLEDLKIQLGQSCLSCGVCWASNEFSFDCKECGGYSITKPCPNCNGNCGNIWTRDFSMSHACGIAKFNGCCKYFLNQFQKLPETSITLINPSSSSVASSCSMSNHFFSNDLTRRLEKLTVQS